MKRINLYFPNVDWRLSIGLIVSSLFEAARIWRGDSHGHRKAYEEKASELIGIQHAITVPTARSGLHVLLSALGVGKGDEVIVTGYTCSAVPEPILQHGAVPIYADISQQNFCLDTSAVEKAITTNTKVIIVQHTYGLAGPVMEVVRIAQNYGIFVIEDCALAFGSSIEGRWLGTYADAAIWSFELSKTLSVGWGGLVGINRDAVLADKVLNIMELAGYQSRLRAAQRLLQGGLSGLLYHHKTPNLLRYHAIAILFRLGIFISSADTPASDLRMPSDMQWKYLLRQLKRLDHILANSQKAREAYAAVLATHGCESGLEKYSHPDTYLIRFPLLVRDIRRCVEFFAISDIEAGRWFSAPVSSGAVPATEYSYVTGSCPIAERVCAHIVNLPLHGRLRNKQIMLIASVLDDYLRKYPDEIEFINSNCLFEVVTHEPK